MATATWVSAWLVFVFKLTLAATASLAIFAALLVVLRAAGKRLRTRSAGAPSNTELQTPAFAMRDPEEE